ncbi:MAG: FAD-dependent oxidoreductase [Actinomycetota bacterium]|nr:FAD-dependent oxidoreductase [Actinomycetota bacterium]
MTTSPRVDVVVIGAGISGLFAARSLARSGVTVRCFEARERVGGRLHSVEIGRNGIDLGATWFWPDEVLVESVARDLGLAVFPQYLEGDALFEAGASGPQRIQGNPIDVPSSRFTWGAQSMAGRLADELPLGSLSLGDPVNALRVDDAGVEVETASGTTSASQVIVAIPPALAAESISFSPVLPDALAETCRRTQVWMANTVKVVAIYAEPFWRRAGLAGAAVSYRGPFREIHDHSGPEGSPAALFGFAGAAYFDGQEPGLIGEAFLDQLVRLFGRDAANPETLHVADWSRERQTTPKTPSPMASTETYGHPLFQLPFLERLHWASTETAPAFAGHIEGALEAGMRAARNAGRAAKGVLPPAPH